MNILLQVKDYIQVNIFIAELKLNYVQEMYYQLDKFQMVQLFVILNYNKVIKALFQEPQAQQQLLLDIVMIILKLESDYLQVLEKPFLHNAEPL